MVGATDDCSDGGDAVAHAVQGLAVSFMADETTALSRRRGLWLWAPAFRVLPDARRRSRLHLCRHRPNLDVDRLDCLSGPCASGSHQQQWVGSRSWMALEAAPAARLPGSRARFRALGFASLQFWTGAHVVHAAGASRTLSHSPQFPMLTGGAATIVNGIMEQGHRQSEFIQRLPSPRLPSRLFPLLIRSATG